MIISSQNVLGVERKTKNMKAKFETDNVKEMKRIVKCLDMYLALCELDELIRSRAYKGQAKVLDYEDWLRILSEHEIDLLELMDD